MRSTNGVNDHLKALEKKGYVHREGNKSRTLRIVRRADDDTAPSAPSAERAAPPRQPLSQRKSNVFNLHVTDDDMIDVPLLGRVAAGVPILAEEHAEDTVRVSSFFLGKGAKSQKVFALKVVGESMIEDGIFDGDFLFVEKTPVARAGDIVVVMIDGEATVKRFYPEGDRIRLQPANARMEPIFVHKRDFRQTDILGLVVGVYRRM
jgi:repressor LexA